MLIDKMTQGTICDELTSIIEDRGESILNDEGIDEKVSIEIAHDCLEKTMRILFERGYFVIEGLENELAQRFGIEKRDLPKAFVEAVNNDVQHNFEGAISQAYADAVDIMSKGHLANMFGNLTTTLFWDCECRDNYIHPKDELACKECGCKAEDMPDSMLREVIRNELI